MKLTIGTPAWRALMQRNWIYRRRNWLASVSQNFHLLGRLDATSRSLVLLVFTSLILTVNVCISLHMQLLEMALPVVFVAIVVAIKNAVQRNTPEDFEAQIIPPEYPARSYTPLTFQDYVTAMQAVRKCTNVAMDGSQLTVMEITGIPNRGYVSYVCVVISTFSLSLSFVFLCC